MSNLNKPLVDLTKEIMACHACESHLKDGIRPVIQAHQSAKILIAGQAPGLKVHTSGVPFDDASGDRLRAWLGVDESVFYDPTKFAIVPMGFCYPGKGVSGDLPPRKECAPLWRNRLLEQLPNIGMTLVIGQYAMRWHLPNSSQQAQSVTETVKAWRSYGPSLLPLPHPSPRNNIWLSKNSWFADDVLPFLQRRVAHLLHTSG